MAWRVIGLDQVKPPESWRAVPMLVEFGETESVPVPAAVAEVRRRTPALTVRPPVQALLLADRTSVPASFLNRLFVRAPKVNGEDSVSVLPAVTVKALLTAFRLNVRAEAKVSVARKPVFSTPLAVIVTVLARSPSAALELTLRRPPWMSRVLPAPPKVLMPPRARKPSPVLVSVRPAPASEMTPSIE